MQSISILFDMTVNCFQLKRRFWRLVVLNRNTLCSLGLRTSPPGLRVDSGLNLDVHETC